MVRVLNAAGPWRGALAAIPLAVAMALAALWLVLAPTLPPADLQTLAIAACLFAAASLASIAGFAFSPIAGAAVFFIADDFLIALQALLIGSIAMQLMGVAALLRSIPAKRFGLLALGGTLGLAPGLALLSAAPAELLLLGVGALTLAVGSLTALGWSLQVPDRGERPLGHFCAGFLGGLTGPTAAFPGAFATIWCAAQPWDKITQRACYQPYILWVQALSLAAISSSAAVPPIHAGDIAAFAAPAAAGAVLGWTVFQRLTNAQFKRFLGVFLVVGGAGLIAKALVGA